MRWHHEVSSSPAILGFVALASLLGPAMAQAYVIEYAFTASGYWADYTGSGGDAVLSNDTISGVVKFNALTVAPPAGAITDGSTYAFVTDGSWVVTTFTGWSSRGSIAPSPAGIPSPTLSQVTAVNNDYVLGLGAGDEIWDQQNYSGAVGPDRIAYSYAHLQRLTSDPAWTSDLNWVGGLAPGGGGYDSYNIIWLGHYVIDADDNYFGYSGEFWIDSFSQVPEPGTIALFGVGLAALGLTRRRSLG